MKQKPTAPNVPSAPTQPQSILSTKSTQSTQSTPSTKSTLSTLSTTPPAPKVANQYQKDTDEEDFLQRLNRILAPYQEEDYRDHEETTPTVFIVGPPRSGSTLLSQLIAAHLEVGYVNNLMAAFWQVPVYGARLSKKLIPQQRPTTFQSTFGRTGGIAEPHEFGYFWANFFGKQHLQQKTKAEEEQVDWERMRKILLNITEVFQKPMFYKYLPMGWYIQRIRRLLQKSCFIRIRRDPVQNAISIFDTRKKFMDSHQQWFSLKPLEYGTLQNKPVWEQVAGQVVTIEQHLDRELKDVPPTNKLELNYTQMCAEPKGILTAVQEMLRKNGSTVEFISPPAEKFQLKLKDINAAGDYAKIARAVDDLKCENRQSG
ncbi:MAG: hypothetical protein GY757_12345, partial [bacterium]|nr:hypothetical protein [bacterium]